MKPFARLTLTALEDRTVPTGFGNAWVDTNLTVSFVPDGTDGAGAPSNLFATLNARMTTAEWQSVVSSVFQEWIAPTNLNVAFVSDDGRALGAPGPVQGSAYVGDIRISARPLSDNVMAITNPFDLVSPWAGEIILNSNKVFDNDRSEGTVDLRTVLLQEVGHALGLDNSDDECSVMYEHGGSPCIDAEDIAAIQAIYGVRAPDRFDANRDNDTLMTSSGLSYIQSVSDFAGTDGTSTAWPFVALGDLTTTSDIDVYYVTPPKEQFNPTVVVQTGGLSSVRLQVSVYYRVASEGANTGQLLATTSTPDARGNYVLSFPQSPGWYTYYVKVQAAPDAGRFNVGSYRLAMGNGLTAIPTSTLTTNINTPRGSVTESADWTAGKPANDTLATATKLGQAGSGADARWDYSGTATLGAATDADVYEVRTGAKSGSTMVVFVSTPAGGAEPAIAVSDSKGNVLAAEVLLRNGDSTIVQIRGVKQNTTYFVTVRSANPAGWAGTESYRVGIDFRAAAIALDSLATGTLTAAQSQLMRELEVTRSQAFRFQLSATGAANEGARFTVFDAAGTAVFTMVAQSGQTVIGDALLAPGRYAIVIVGGTNDGAPLSSLQVDAHYLTLTDPIGPALADDYTGLAASADSSTSSTSSVASPAPDDGYYWLAPATSGSGYLALTNPYSFVWW